MTEQVSLALDLGAESGRVMAGLWDGERLRLDELHRFPNGPVELAGTMRWDTLRLCAELQNGLALAGRKYGDRVSSLGVDTWGVDYVLLSRAGEILGQPFHYRDRRTRGVMARAFEMVPRAEIFRRTGIQFMEINTLYQLLACQKNSPELLEAAETFLTTPDFLNWTLCGRRAAEFSIATTTQCFDPSRRAWAAEMLGQFGLPARIFPEIVPPGTELGLLRPEIRERTGLGQARVAAPATHDTGSAVAAVPTEKTGRANWAYLSSGTWSLLGVEVQQPVLSEAALRANFTNEGGVNYTYRLLKNISGLWLVQQCKKEFEKNGGKHDYGDLVHLASESPALISLIDAEDSRFISPDNMPGAMQQYCRETTQPIPETKGALVRCALESLALTYRRVLRTIENLTGEPIEVIHIVGGGSRNDLLNQFTADACERQVVAGPVEATAIGNILTQIFAREGRVDLREMREVVRRSFEVRSFEPNPKMAEQWTVAEARMAGNP